MYKKLKTYLKFLEKQSAQTLKSAELTTLNTQLLTYIQFFQHERLIHLLVTLFFALFTLIATIFAIYTQNLFFIAISGLFLLLLFPYVIHYYHLENGVQKLYDFYHQFNS